MKTRMNKEFFWAYLAQEKPSEDRLEWLVWAGQPMLYDSELYVIRRKLETQHEIYVNIKGLRCV